MKIRHYRVEEERNAVCPVSGKPATIVHGSASISDPEIIVEREYQGDFVAYRVTLRGVRLREDRCLVTFIGERDGIQQLKLSLYDHNTNGKAHHA